MRFTGSVVKEQGVTFGIVVVKPYVLQSPSERERMQIFGRRAFGLIPIILMAQNARGIPTYYGRKDIVNFLAKVPTRQLPLQEYTIA